ncbi:MAG: Serine/threonine protein kinase, partial [Frankiales bacterium]|nr:Serine/threonine protein kinase [Frankiales bacterium]
MTEVWTLPGYDVQALLGFGATGEVWRARELATGDTVALKRLRAGADPAALTALRREAALLGTLATPYVVRLRAVLGEDADTVLVLDLAAGGSLAALLGSRGRLDPGEVVTVAAPLAQALAAAHASGLVHGDVSPSNVLFTADGMPLLSDLGLARPVADPVGAVEGTAEYVDPAVAAGGRPDAASDVWALAAVCHHMLSGTPPHDGTSAEDVLQAARQGARAPLGLLAPTAPRALVAAVEQALRTDPAERPD